MHIGALESIDKYIVVEPESAKHQQEDRRHSQVLLMILSLGSPTPGSFSPLPTLTHLTISHPALIRGGGKGRQCEQDMEEESVRQLTNHISQLIFNGRPPISDTHATLLEKWLDLEMKRLALEEKRLEADVRIAELRAGGKGVGSVSFSTDDVIVAARKW